MFFVELKVKENKSIYSIERDIEKAMQNEHPHILKIIKYEAGVGNEFECGASPSWNVIYEHYVLTLEIEMLNRYSRNHRFPFQNKFLIIYFF